MTDASSMPDDAARHLLRPRRRWFRLWLLTSQERKLMDFLSESQRISDLWRPKA